MRLPDDSQRIVIVGHTGSGKTHEGLHQLSQRSIDTMPWVMIDQKGKDLVAQVPVTAPATLDGPVPTDPGLYAIRAGWEDINPGGPLDRYLLSVCEAGNTGVFIDEGQLLGQNNRGLRTLLTQGRSLGCPLIFVCQRPVFVDTFVFGCADYMQCFILHHPDDRDRIERHVPADKLDFGRLHGAKHHSWYYDPAANTAELIGPAPPFNEIYDRILTRLPKYEDAPDDPIPRRIRV